MLTMGSLFDGIGGFPLAAVHNGITPVWASEIEPFPMEVTKLRFPDMVHVGDITKLDGAKLPPVHVICGGSPCQDLSVAGQRRGLAGERSGLFMDQIRIVKEMRKADERRGIPAYFIRPRYLIWENVPGAFSSADGEDFRAVIEEIVRVKDSACHVPRSDTGRWESAGAAILGDEFSLAWRVLDAQYWGVAQRRRRIFLVADFGGHTAPQILFKQDSLSGDTAPGRSEGENAASAAEGSTDDTGGACLTPWDVQSRRVFEESGVWPALYGGEGGGHGYIQTEEIRTFHVNQRDEVIDLQGISGALLATRNMQMQTFVACEPKLCLNDHGGQRMDITEEMVPTLRAGAGGHLPLVVQPEDYPDSEESCGGSHANPPLAAGVVSKGDGDCFLIPEIHTSLTSGGGQAGQGYPCVLTAAFVPGAGAAAQTVGYQEECAPTIKTSHAPAVLCLNDQGGSQMHLTENISGTLRAQEHGHQPLVMATQQGGAEIGEGVCPTITASAGMSGNNQPVLFENHGIDARYTGPHTVAPTMSARMGTGGNNVPLVGTPVAFSLDSKDSNSMKSGNPYSGCRQTELARTIDTTNPDPSKNQGGIAILQEAICIAGNIIDREVQNGGNGLGCQPDISYTLTGMDRHAVFSRQRSDEFSENDVTATQSARQSKDATDLICQPYQQTVGTIGYSDHKGVNNQFVSEDKCIVEKRNLIRRLTPLECERLQGFPDGWTDIPGASDSARYKALGNSVAIPCVDFVLRGIAYFLRKFQDQ